MSLISIFQIIWICIITIMSRFPAFDNKYFKLGYALS